MLKMNACKMYAKTHLCKENYTSSIRLMECVDNFMDNVMDVQNCTKLHTFLSSLYQIARVFLLLV